MREAGDRRQRPDLQRMYVCMYVSNVEASMRIPCKETAVCSLSDNEQSMAPLEFYVTKSGY